MTKVELTKLLETMPDDAFDITIGGNGGRLAFSSWAHLARGLFKLQQNQQWAPPGGFRYIEVRLPLAGKGAKSDG